MISYHGYQAGRFGAETLKLARKWVSHHFGCLPLTLEMPFDDHALLLDPHGGWDGARSKRLSGAMLHPILAFLTNCRPSA